jgi:hypothetical protein
VGFTLAIFFEYVKILFFPSLIYLLFTFLIGCLVYLFLYCNFGEIGIFCVFGLGWRF